jgi:hypothetical protein
MSPDAYRHGEMITTTIHTTIPLQSDGYDDGYDDTSENFLFCSISFFNFCMLHFTVTVVTAAMHSLWPFSLLFLSVPSADPASPFQAASFYAQVVPAVLAQWWDASP